MFYITYWILTYIFLNKYKVSVQEWLWLMVHSKAAYIGIFGGLGLFALILMVTYFETVRHTLKQFQETWELQIEKKFRFSENKVECLSNEMYLESSWARYSKALETRNVYLLYLSDYQYVIIPKRVFQSEEQKTNFVALLKTKGLLK